MTPALDEAFLQAIQDDPTESLHWHALADWLEEGGQSDRAELVRLNVALRHATRRARKGLSARLIALVQAGVAPCVPTLTNSLGMSLVLIPPGTFLMGSPKGENGRYTDETPVHEVEISRAFYLGRCPVTQAEYRAVTGTNPSTFAPTGPHADRVVNLDTQQLPADNISWNLAVEFCRKLSALPKEKAAGREYRLPTEAEWEYACRAGTNTPFAYGESLSPEWANFAGRDDRGCPTPVGSYPPNAWGLFDVHGNVVEWVADRFDHNYYRISPRADPTGPEEGSQRVLRGGAWSYSERNCRSAFRVICTPEYSNENMGFRVVCTVSRPVSKKETPAPKRRGRRRKTEEG